MQSLCACMILEGVVLEMGGMSKRLSRVESLEWLISLTALLLRMFGKLNSQRRYVRGKEYRNHVFD